MITYWHTTQRSRDGVVLEADVHGRTLQVEHRTGERTWRWAVRSPHGRLLASGTSPDHERAEAAAEDEAYRAHAPVGDVVAFWSD